MREENKIKLTTIAAMLSKQTGKTYSAREIRVLLCGWIKHPKYLSTSNQVLWGREKRDGYGWLNPKETASFFEYAGYPLK